MKRPNCKGSFITSPKAAESLILLGGNTYKSVSFTRDEYRSIQKFYEFTEEDNPLYQAGADRNMFRTLETDGLRLLGWLARYVEPGQDPLKVLIQFAIEAGVDVDPSDVDYSESD